MAPFIDLLSMAILNASMILRWLILARIIFSWLRIGPNNPITAFIYNITEIFLAPVRKLIAKSPFGGPGMMLDFSPIVTVLLLQVVSSILVQLLRGLV